MSAVPEESASDQIHKLTISQDCNTCDKMEEIPEENTRLLANDISDVELEQQYHQYNMSLPKAPILYSLWMGSFLGSLDSTIVANIMNRVAEEFEASDKKQWIVTSFLLTNTAFQPLYGKLSDITGRKTALMVAHSLFMIGCLFTCFSTSLEQFAISRAVCGMGAGGINALSSITVSDICSAKERGVYQGYANIVFSTGALLGGPIGGLIMDKFGWQLIFACQVPLIMTCMFLGFRNVNIKLTHIPPIHERYTLKNLKRIDLGGSLSLICTIAGFLCLTSIECNKAIVGTFTVASFIVFVLNELYWAPERIIPIHLLSGSFGISSFITILASFILFGDVFRNPIYLQLVQGISLTSTGGFLLFSSIAGAISSLISGWILRHTKMNLAKCAYVLITAAVMFEFLGLMIGYTLISHLEPNPTSYVTDDIITTVQKWAGQSHSKIWFSYDQFTWRIIYVTSMFLITFGYAMLLVASLVSIVFTIPKSQQATITGCFYLWRSIGTIIGASTVLTIYESTVSTNLYDYLHSLHLDEEYEVLVHNSSYLREHFKGHVLKNLLDIYKSGFLTSYIPTIVVSVATLLISFCLLSSYKAPEKSAKLSIV